MSLIILRPKPLYFIKSIAEQGYQLETALADLIDNSITADASEINIFSDEIDNNQCLFIADNGSGMSNEILLEALRMPSQSMENQRSQNDLGRFGLGLKTASFSQARKITVISKTQSQNEYYGYCWDLKNLEDDWNIKRLNTEEINFYLNVFELKKTKSNIGSETESKISTLIIWEELFKETSIEEFQHSLTFTVKDHLSLVFHRFLDKGTIRIFLGNFDLKGFNPFPDEMPRLQFNRFYPNDSFTVQGYILPYNVLKLRSESDMSKWTMPGRNLSDMEGIYLYRGDRLIYYGGWAKLHRRYQYLKLGRLMINIKNTHDDLFQINVAKSTMQIPKIYSNQIREIISDLAEQTKTVYFQKQPNSKKAAHLDLYRNIMNKDISDKGVIFTLNEKNDAYKILSEAVQSHTLRKLLKTYTNNIIKNLNKYVNIDNGHIEEIQENNKQKISKEDIENFKKLGLSDYDIMQLLN